MSTTTHTPGPWKIDPVFIAQTMTTSLHFGEYRFPYQRTAEGLSRTYPREEAEANARLIAAAPDLLRALELIVEWSEDPDVISGTLDLRAARAAILRAREGQ